MHFWSRSFFTGWIPYLLATNTVEVLTEPLRAELCGRIMSLSDEVYDMAYDNVLHQLKLVDSNKIIFYLNIF